MYSFTESLKLLPDFIAEQFVLLTIEQLYLCLGVTCVMVGVFIGVSSLVSLLRYCFTLNK